MNQTRFSKLFYVLLLFVLVACQAQATSVPTTAPLPATAIPSTMDPIATAVPGPTTFTPDMFKIPMSLSFDPNWQVSYNLPGKFSVGTNDFGLSFYVVTDAKLTDPIDAHLIPFPEDFLSWIKSDPDFNVVESTPVTVAGIAGVQIDATPIWKSTTHLKLFLSLSGDITRNLEGQPDGENIVTDPEQWRFILLDNVNGERLLIILIDGNGHNFDDAVAQSQQVLDTVVFGKP